ncbi:MAG: hypothetical protein AMS21_13550 [Gemmatimonas sp. SG8_38_2]|nr:MAG: hypothetical protein AMS21_13550 [Gemmatimonas sp. SG8_38_2]
MAAPTWLATTNGGADLAVTFDLAADGEPALGYDTARRAYFNNGGTRTDLRDFATLTDNDGGNYTITVAGAGPEAANNNRWLFQVVAGDDRDTRAYFYADFPASPFAEDVSPVAVAAEACAACHGPQGIQVHGGGFAAVDGGEPCLVCHGSDESDDPEVVPPLFAVTHGYHSSIWVEDGEVIEVTYPTYMNNCSVCHSTEEQLTAANGMAYSGPGCFSCHGSIEGIPIEDELVAGQHAAFDETTNCQTCHVEGSFASDYVAVTDSHNGATTERGGVIWDGIDTSVTEGALIDWQITGVTDDGINLTITWQASYNGTFYDPCNDIPTETVPFAFHEIPPIIVEGEDPDDRNNLSILRNYAQGEDFILGTDPDAAGQPDGSVGVDDTNTTCEGLVATTVVPVEETDATYGRVGIQGKPWVLNVDLDGEDEYMQVRAKSPTMDWEIGVGATEDPVRRAIVDTTGKCLNCHVGSMYQHGGNRVDNVDLCTLCHNTAANDQYVRWMRPKPTTAGPARTSACGKCCTPSTPPARPGHRSSSTAAAASTPGPVKSRS